MAYGTGGIEGLRSKRQGNNARKLTLEQHRQVKAQLEQYRPVDLHLSQGEYWTVSDLYVPKI
jgi:hypothetical protein